MNWIENIGASISKVMDKVRPPVQSIPPILLLCEIMDRPGLSAISIASSVISRLETAGIHTETNPCGLENMDNKFVKIFVEEAVKHIKTYGKAESVIDIGGVSFTGQGGNSGGPVVMNLLNTNNAKYGGLIE